MKLWQPLLPTPAKWGNPPSLDHRSFFKWHRCIWTSLPVLCPLCRTDDTCEPLCARTSNHFCSGRRRRSQALRISSGSVFHLIGSRVCWLTAPRWRPRTPCGRRLYSLAGPAVWCKRAGAGTWDTCLSVYCSLWKKRVDREWNKQLDLCVFVSSFMWATPTDLSPPRLSSVSVFLVDEPTAVSRLMEWSVRLLQWERSSFVKWGMWRITRRRVESLMSRPASRKYCMDRNWLRLSQPGRSRCGRGGVNKCRGLDDYNEGKSEKLE